MNPNKSGTVRVGGDLDALDNLSINTGGAESYTFSDIGYTIPLEDMPE